MLKILALILIILMLLVGGDRGGKAIIALVGNILASFLVIIFSSFGISVYLVAIIGGMIIAGITLFYQNGKNRKTLSAFCGTIITMAVLLVLIYFVVWKSEAYGMNEIQMMEDDISYYNMNLGISMRNVEIAVIWFSTLGAVLDMSLTVTTSMNEIRKHSANMKSMDLIVSGINMGKTTIGTTLNTLLFAYLGESLLIFFHMRMQKMPLEVFLNSKILFQSLVSVIMGMTACIIVMPLSAFFMSKTSLHS